MKDGIFVCDEDRGHSNGLCSQGPISASWLRSKKPLLRSPSRNPSRTLTATHLLRTLLRTLTHHTLEKPRITVLRVVLLCDLVDVYYRRSLSYHPTLASSQHMHHRHRHHHHHHHHHHEITVCRTMLHSIVRSLDHHHRCRYWCW